MAEWQELCPTCIEYDAESGICHAKHFKVADYPKKFIKLCNGKLYSEDAVKKRATEAEKAAVPRPDPRHSLPNSVDTLDAWQPHSGCLNCGSEDDLVPARFYYGFHGRDTRIEALTKTTTHRFRITGEKSAAFCQPCIDGWIKDRKSQRKAQLLKLLIGFVIWVALLTAAGFAGISALTSIVILAGIVAYIRLMIKISRNVSGLNALSKRMGEVKFQDFLDKEVWNHMLIKLGGKEAVSLPYSMWTQSSAAQIRKMGTPDFSRSDS